MKHKQHLSEKHEKKVAIFFDRDGTLIDNPNDEPPRTPDEVVFYPTVIESLNRLQEAGFSLFLISNQPDFLKGKNTMGELRAVHVRFNNILFENGINFKEYFYCFHREEDDCICRKPSPHYIRFAEKQYNLDLEKSWIVGDRDADIACGQRAGLSTILIGPQIDGAIPDYAVTTLQDAASIILGEKNLW
jgi:D-glycero-D-manno-heptose 1,7-bisphosphate phosphatase